MVLSQILERFNAKWHSNIWRYYISPNRHVLPNNYSWFNETIKQYKWHIRRSQHPDKCIWSWVEEESLAKWSNTRM